jgi:hypothetical protein
MAIALLGLVAAAVAQEKKAEPPRITAVTPLRVIAGETQTVRLRGAKLKEAIEVRSTPALGATVKEKKDAAVPNGLEAKDVGDQELVVELVVPADCAAKTIALEVVTPAGTTAPREIAVGAKDAEVREKEPNNGFREAQPWDGAKPLAGRIEGDKDVDVFRIEARAGQPLTIRITAAAAGSLLDPTLALFNAAGQLLASADDSADSRDARLSFVPKTDGPLCLVVSDAHDRGSAWHEYRIEREAQP